ncbi:MAG: T9SS type A sorting domain-containing protein [Bacteroidetes bacterium]|nr:T9SS type A sorting domain-containing protein [Bacteroidota bacterium]
MKTKNIVITAVIAIPAFILLTSGTLETMDSNGKLASSGAPGESTCSQSGCHGSGNGSSSTGGLADNAGPGSITLTSTPSLTANHYTPGATYHMTVTVHETGKSLFGFDFEALDNSGNTNPMVNNAVGTIVITDAVHTRMGQPFGTGRVTCTHQPSGGAVANTASFVFDWVAPSSGTVNMYYDGIAANSDGLSNAGDNVYAHSLQITPLAATGIEQVNEKSLSFDMYPNPATDQFTIVSSGIKDGPVNVSIYNMNGSLVRVYDTEDAVNGSFFHTYESSSLPRGLYLLKATSGEGTMTSRLMIH